MSETRIRIYADGVEQTHQRRQAYWYNEHSQVEIHLEGQRFGLGHASGDGCNCLIDTLRQLLPIGGCDVAAVRENLEALHRGCDTHIEQHGFLGLVCWEGIANRYPVTAFCKALRPLGKWFRCRLRGPHAPRQW